MSSAGRLPPGFSLSGHPLEGTKIVRIIYLDDAGLSNPRHEPFTVVAGPLVDADAQWLEIEHYLSELADEYAPKSQRDEFYFHATELFSGGGFFPRDKWAKEDRWKILDQLVAIPRKFKLPITFGIFEKSKIMARYPNMSGADRTVYCHTIAFTVAAFAADWFLRNGEDIRPGEVGSIVVENNDQSRKMIRGMHQFMKNPKNHELFRTTHFGSLSIKRIIGTPHFEEKAGASLLQIADACAFAIKRHYMKTPESDRFYQPLKPGLLLADRIKAA